MAHTAQLDPWHAVTDTPHLTSSTEEHIKFALRAAILAPSSHNTQPWRFRVNDETIELFADRSRALPVVDPHHRELIMSCGAALFHLRVALRALGHDPVVTRIPGGGNPELLARLELGARVEPSAENRLLWEAIPARRTNRLPFEQRPIPKRLAQELKHVVAREGAQLALITTDEAKSHVCGLIIEGDRLQWDDRRFRAEVAAWTPANHSARQDGIPAREPQLSGGSSALAVLLTDWEGPAEWLAAGEALDHLLLLAQAEGVSASYLNQPVEEAGLRPRLRKLLGEHGFPQLVLRLGYPLHESSPTPRRALEDVVL